MWDLLVPGTAGHADLDLLFAEPTVHVALVALAPVYMHGLKIGMAGAGLACTLLRSVGELPALLGLDGPLVAVLQHSDVAGLAALELLPHAAPETVHVLAEDTVQAYANALGSGATGAFPETAELDRVISTVRSAALGYTLLPQHVARSLSRPQVGPPPHLEPPERAYLRLLAAGGTVASLARRSGYSEREMYRLLSGTYRRLGAHNRTEALLLAERWGLLEEETG